MRYDPGISKMATSIPLCASIIIRVNKNYKDMVGDDASSLDMYHLCSLWSVHFLPFNFPRLFLLLSLLHVVAPFFILWGCPGSVPPSPSYPLSGCNPFTWLLLLIHCSSLSLSWISLVWTSHPNLFCVCHAWILCFFFQCWFIGCHISSLQISFWGARHLSLHLPFWVSFF